MPAEPASANVVALRPEQPPTPERFRVTDDRTAAWCFRKLAQAQARIDSVNATRDDEIARWTEWATDSTKDERATVERMSGLLEEWARSERERGRKTARTPYGQVSSRESAGKLVVTDEDAACDWAKANGLDALAEVRWKFKAAEAKKILKPKDGQYLDPATGEVIPGLAFEPGNVTYTVKPDLSTSPVEGPAPEGAA